MYPVISDSGRLAFHRNVFLFVFPFLDESKTLIVLVGTKTDGFQDEIKNLLGMEKGKKRILEASF